LAAGGSDVLFDPVLVLIRFQGVAAAASQVFGRDPDVVTHREILGRRGCNASVLTGWLPLANLTPGELPDLRL
jgi:hypothetical protein